MLVWKADKPSNAIKPKTFYVIAARFHQIRNVTRSDIFKTTDIPLRKQSGSIAAKI